MDNITLDDFKALKTKFYDCLDEHKSLGGWEPFTDWCNLEENKVRMKGLSRTTVIYSVEMEFTNIEKKLTESETGQIIDLDLKDVNRLKTAQKFVDAFKEYKEYRILNKLPEDISWNVYFYYHLHASKEPQLGQGILKIKDNLASLTNIEDGISSDYFGEWEYFEIGVLSFDLKANKNGKSIHIKVYCSDLRKDSILIGAFVSFEDLHITSGSILFESKNIAETPNLYSVFVNKNQLENTINSDILSYLSLKKYNFLKVKRNIINESRLEEFVHKDVKEEKNTRFIDYPIPKIFIAFPTNVLLNSNSRQLLEELIERLQENNPQVKVIFNDGSSQTMQAMEKPPSFVQLQRCRFFVLFCFKNDVNSLSTVQLGWAIAYCKKIVVFYEEGSVSSNFIKLRSLGVHIEKFKSIDDDIDYIYNVIDMEVNSSLGKYNNLV